MAKKKKTIGEVSKISSNCVELTHAVYDNMVLFFRCHFKTNQLNLESFNLMSSVFQRHTIMQAFHSSVMKTRRPSILGKNKMHFKLDVNFL